MGAHQAAVAEEIKRDSLTASEVEVLVADRKGKRAKTTQANRSQVKLNTSKATLVLTFFRRRKPANAEVATALREALAQIEGTGQAEAA
jgi:hypothetical protein